MGAPDLLRHLRGNGLVLTLTPAGKLHVAPGSALTDELRAAIRASRDALVASLLAEHEVPQASSSHRWMLHFVRGRPLSVTFSPAATLVDVLTRYPGAVAAEAANDPVAQEVPTVVAEAFDACVAAGLYSDDERPILAAMFASDPTGATALVDATRERIGRCLRCRHFTRPGLSDGYCTARDDLSRVYGFLRSLPADRGATCSMYREAP